MAELPIFSRHLGNRAEEHDDDVRFFTGSENTASSRMRNASGHNYWNSSLVMDLAMGQIPRSTERMSSLYTITLLIQKKRRTTVMTHSSKFTNVWNVN